MFKGCLPPLHLAARDLQRDERIFKHKGLLCAVSSSSTAILFSKEIKRELKYLTKPDLGSVLVAGGCTVDGANAPGCINFNGKVPHCSSEKCLAFGDRDRAQLCAAGEGSSLALHTTVVLHCPSL